MKQIIGTHNGRLDDEARHRRVAKNLRNRNRSHPQHPVHHHDMPVRGSQRKEGKRK